jgi:glycosyltransferase involved in cell wall biosynthesis
MSSSFQRPKKQGTLLVLSTYPIRRPRHGGQLRSAALMTEYNKVFDKVIRTAVFNSTVYSQKEFGRTDIPSPKELTDQIVANPELESWILGNSPDASKEIREKITQLIFSEKPDVILFEQPFLYLGMEKVLQELGSEIPMIYSSHNVESHMMREIFASQSLEKKYATELTRLEKSERSLTQSAIGIIAVSEEDQKMLSKWGGNNIIVQGNGVNPLKTSKLKKLRVRRVMNKLGITSYALFVGSSHRPNIDGFIELVGTRLGYLPPDSMIFLAGDIARGLQPEINKIDPTWGSLMWARMYNWDRVSEKTLAALIAEATCILLPITTGGGSNLKTAEAMNSGKKIVATEIAMRGFTEIAQNGEVRIAQSAKGFRQALVELIRRQTEEASKSSNAILYVTWERQLSKLGNWLGKSINKVIS